MSSTTPATDQPLVHQYIRLFGRRPTETDLLRYQQAQSRVTGRLPARVRRGVARVITRL